MFPYALGDVNKEVVLTIPNNGQHNPEHGSTVRYSTGQQFSVPQRTLDSFEFTNIDLIKIDVEGGELEVCLGGYNTIVKSNPVVMFENKRKENEKVVDFFTKLGYNIKQHKSDTVAYYE